MTKIKRKLKIYLVIIVLNLLFNIIYSDTNCKLDDCISNGFECSSIDGKTCNSQCRPKYGSEECIFCSSINRNDFYTIDDDSSSCSKGCSKNYIIYDSKQCVDEDISNSLFLLGGFYYKSCPENSEPKYNSMECKCKYYYYTEEKGNNKKLFHCLEKDEDCPSENKFHNLGEKECIPACLNSIDSNDLTKNYYQGDNNICYLFSDCKFINEAKNKCLSSCDIGEGFYIKGDTNKICYNTCPDGNRFRNFGTNICINACNLTNNDKKYHKVNEYICYSSCKDIDDGTFIYETSGACSQEECSYYYSIDNNVKSCTNEDGCIQKQLYFIKGKECLRECNGYKANYSKGKTTITECFDSLLDCFTKDYTFYDKELKICWKSMPDQDKYYINSKIDGKYELVPNCQKYFYKDSEDNNKYCINDCWRKGKYFLNKNNECVSSCKEINDRPNKYQYFDPSNNECLKECIGRANLEFSEKANDDDPPKPCQSECPEGKFYFEKDKFILNDCGQSFYSYSNPKLCLEKCGDDEKVKIENEKKKCVPSCEKYYIDIKDTNNQAHLYYECKTDCTGYYIDLQKKECFQDSCYPSSDYYINNDLKLCYPNCPANYYFIDIRTYTCGPSCPSGFKKLVPLVESEKNQVYKNIFLCYPNCPPEKYIFDDECVTLCPEPDFPFANDKICVDICPEEKRYYIKNFIHGETDIQKNCLTNCPEDYPFYKIIKYKDNKYYECLGSCEGYYAPNLDDPNKIGKLCLDDCPDPNNDAGDGTDEVIYKYKLEDEEGKKCYKKCPAEKPYHKEVFGSECLSSCEDDPDDAHFHEGNSEVCKKIEDCPEDKFIDYDLKLFVDSCSDSKVKTEVKLDSTIEITKTICSNECIPKYGEYLTPYKTCVTNCTKETNKYLKNDYKNKKCICQGLYYIDQNTFEMNCYPNSVEKCTDKGTQPGYKIKMFETNECIQICNNNKILSPSEDICYNETYQCPPNTKEINIDDKRICDCRYKFYIIKDQQNQEEQEVYQKICLDEDGFCPADYDKYIPETKECIKGDECPEPFNHLFEKHFCLRECPQGSNNNGDKCDCERYWYEKSDGNYECLKGFCLDNYRVYAPETMQCLKRCSGSYYPYLFDDKCYNDCRDYIEGNNNTINAQNSEPIPIISTYSDFGCGCKRLWYYEKSKNNKLVCINDKNITDCTEYSKKSFKYTVKKTGQCVNECPEDYPYSFNQWCFKSCEDEAKSEYLYNVKTDGSSKNCKCQNLWHITDPDKNYKECINEDKCILFNSTKIYEIERTKECVEKCPSLFRFNYICYDQCPDKTIDKLDSEGNHECVCNTNDGLWFWYDYEEYNKTYYKCGLEECPLYNINNNDYSRMNILRIDSKNNKCVKNCSQEGGGEYNKYNFSFRNVCVMQCPNLTKDYNFVCKFYDVNDEEYINSLEKLKDAADIQAKELFEQNALLGGFLLNKFNSSLQIYEIDRLNTYKKVSMKSNLTYIDFGTCLEKIFLDNHLSDNDKF